MRRCASDRLWQPGQAALDRLGAADGNRRGLAEPSGNDCSNRVVGPIRTAEVAKPIFEKHEVQYKERRDDKPTSFRREGSWFRGAEVDRLSLEEAREIAETGVGGGEGSAGLG